MKADEHQCISDMIYSIAIRKNLLLQLQTTFGVYVCRPWVCPSTPSLTLIGKGLKGGQNGRSQMSKFA